MSERLTDADFLQEVADRFMPYATGEMCERVREIGHALRAAVTPEPVASPVAWRVVTGGKAVAYRDNREEAEHAALELGLASGNAFPLFTAPPESPRSGASDRGEERSDDTPGLSAAIDALREAVEAEREAAAAKCLARAEILKGELAGLDPDDEAAKMIMPYEISVCEELAGEISARQQGEG